MLRLLDFRFCTLKRDVIFFVTEVRTLFFLVVLGGRLRGVSFFGGVRF